MSDSALGQALRELVEQYVTPGEPGVVVGVCQDGRPVATVVAGLADVEREVPITEQSVFDIASSSKQICATTLLLLERDGLLSLDDPLDKHLTGLRLRERVTLRHCLQHTAGLREYFSLCLLVGAGPDAWKREDDVIRLLRAQRDTDFAPGTDWSYSNTGYLAAAAVVRAVTGKGLAEVAQERVFAPLGMSDTRFQDDPRALIRHRATGHALSGERFHRADGPDEVVGDGGVLTTVVDAAKWLAFVADGRVLGRDVRDKLLSRTVLQDGEVLPYCLGIEHETVGGRPAAGHGGAVEGYRAQLSVLLDGSGLAVVVMANRSDLRVNELARAALERAVGASAPPVPPAGEPSPAEDVVGLWLDEREMSTMSVVREDDGSLALELGPARVELHPSGPGRWSLPAVGRAAALIRQADRLVFEIGVHTWRQRTMRRIEQAGASEAPVGAYLSRELNALATITESDGQVLWQCGAAASTTLQALSVVDHWHTSEGGVIVVDRAPGGRPAGVRVSGARMRGVVFEAYTPSALATELPLGFPVGFPVPLGGPAGPL